MHEIWKDIPSVPELEASSLGRIRIKPYSCKTPNGGVRHYNNLKPTYGVPNKNSTVRHGAEKHRFFYNKRLGKTFNVARLVCEAFNGPHPNDKPIVMHLDEDASNNTPSNLKWGTQRENLSMPKVKEAFKNRTGDRSCWSIHKKKRQAMLEIERNIPLPARSSGNSATPDDNRLYNWHSMNVGDCIKAPDDKGANKNGYSKRAASMQSSWRRYAKVYAPDRQYTIRRIDQNVIGAWRVK